ncbi:MAG: porin family protein [Filimonas sp.]|nr:porin family protein [Filimonas sp.]
MKRRIINITAMLAVLVGVSLSAQAQKGAVKMGLYYDYSMPIGSFKSDYISNGSPRGVGGEIMYNLSRQWGLGLNVAWQDYYQKYPRAIYSLDKNQDISAVVTNSVQSAPILIKTVFSPLGNDRRTMIQPYISAAAGLNLLTNSQYLGQFNSSDASARFMAQAGAGVQIPFSKLSNSAFFVGATYNYISYNKNGLNNFNTIDLQAGVRFPL